MTENENPHEDIQYRGAKLTEEDQKKLAAERESHKDDVVHVQYRGEEADMSHEKPEKHVEHIQYRGAEDDVEL